MAGHDSSSTNNMDTAARNTTPIGQSTIDVTPPVGITPPAVLAEQAASGRRGAAWRLMHWIMEDDPRAVIAVASLDDDRLAQHLLEFIAQGTWAGKPFVVPPPLRSAHARTRLRTLFLPEAGMSSVRAERVLLAATHDRRPAMRANAMHILGIIKSHAALPVLIEALNDPVPSVRLQAAKALGRIGDPAAVPALLNALHTADEQMGSQIFLALVDLGRPAVPSLITGSNSRSAWIRWHCMRALGEIGDSRAIPVLVHALADTDHSVAWMSAKSLVRFGKRVLEPVLHLLVVTETSPWLVETASYVLHELYLHNPDLKPYLEPVVQNMHGVAFRIATPNAARAALAQLTAEGMLSPAR